MAHRLAPCRIADHEALKLSPAWASLRLVGRQHVEADEDFPASVLELRDCHCGSTLAVEVAK